MIRNVIGVIAMLVAIALYVFEMVYANCMYGYDAMILVFIGSISAFAFLAGYELIASNNREECEDASDADKVE